MKQGLLLAEGKDSTSAEQCRLVSGLADSLGVDGGRGGGVVGCVFFFFL